MIKKSSSYRRKIWAGNSLQQFDAQVTITNLSGHYGFSTLFFLNLLPAEIFATFMFQVEIDNVQP
jgi:hypothetical protein